MSFDGLLILQKHYVITVRALATIYNLKCWINGLLTHTNSSPDSDGGIWTKDTSSKPATPSAAPPASIIGANNKQENRCQTEHLQKA